MTKYQKLELVTYPNKIKLIICYVNVNSIPHLCFPKHTKRKITYFTFPCISSGN